MPQGAPQARPEHKGMHNDELNKERILQRMTSKEEFAERTVQWHGDAVARQPTRHAARGIDQRRETDTILGRPAGAPRRCLTSVEPPGTP
jgi:hypothetical protein